jgi:hypothetical protein
MLFSTRLTNSLCKWVVLVLTATSYSTTTVEFSTVGLVGWNVLSVTILDVQM